MDFLSKVMTVAEWMGAVVVVVVGGCLLLAIICNAGGEAKRYNPKQPIQKVELPPERREWNRRVGNLIGISLAILPFVYGFLKSQ